jgi:hypothetical protein
VVCILNILPQSPVTSTEVSDKVNNYIRRNHWNNGDISLKQIQSAIKVNGVTCEDLYHIVNGLNYKVTPGPVSDSYYSQYVVE